MIQDDGVLQARELSGIPSGSLETMRWLVDNELRSEYPGQHIIRLGYTSAGS